jgi:hypothetical protein
VALLSLLLNTARIKESRAAPVQARRTGPTSGCPVKIEEPLFAFPYFGLLNTRISGLVLLAIVVSLIFHDMQYGPQAALIAESFGTNIRYSGAGLGYQLASVIAGGPAPLIAAAILQSTGSSTWISIYIIACCVVSMIALLLMPRRGPTYEPPSVGAPAASASTTG